PDGSEVAQQFLPPSFSPGFSTTGDGATWYEQNIDEAKALLAAAGVAEGTEIELAYRNVARGYLPEAPPVAQEIQAQLAEIGLNVVIREIESTEFLDATAAGQVGFYLLGWGADYPAATNFYNYHFANTQNLQFGEGYTEIFDTITQAGQISDPAERQALYDQVAALIKRDVPMIPMAHGGSAVVYSAAVEGAHTSPLGNELFYVMSAGKDTFTFVQNGEPAALWCGDETDGESLRACNQVYDALMAYQLGGVAVEPGLAESYTANPEGTEWTFSLRQGVKFHNGADLDANDVVATFEAQWNAKSPNHVGREGNFEYWGAFFGAFLNAD
ncbi:MAG TPA: ABC transporter substrate-binding protein, partial [Anaerolineales bacterium]|nr:ABC transporter substrate-binding protein [Anaerolineales bacterium]